MFKVLIIVLFTSGGYGGSVDTQVIEVNDLESCERMADAASVTEGVPVSRNRATVMVTAVCLGSAESDRPEVIPPPSTGPIPVPIPPRR